MKGELTTPEIRKLIKAHNVLVSIKIPKGAKREDIIALVKKNGYMVNHEKQALVPKVEMQRKKTIGLKKAQEITKPKPLTEEQKKKRQQAKQKKAGEKAFLKTVIPKPPPVSKPSKGVKVGKPPPKPKKKEAKKEEKLYEKEYNEFLKMFNEAKEKRSRTPFLKLRDRIMRFTEPILVGTASFKVQDGARLKALKEPFMKKIQVILESVDTQIKKYVEIGKKTVGGQQTRPKKEIKISNKPALNTKKIEPKKKEEPKKQEPKIDIMKEIIDDWGSDANNVVIEQKHKKLKDGIVGLWDSNKKFINIDGIFQFDKKLFNTLFMKYPAQKVIDGLKKFMLYITDSDDEDRIGQSDFSKWFEIRDGRTQSQIRGKDLNQSTLNRLIKEWEIKFGKKKEVKKDEPKKEAPKKKSKDEKSPPPLRFSGSKSKIDKIKSKVKKGKISVEEGLKEWKIDIEAYERRRKVIVKSLINKGYKSGGVDELKALEKEGIEIIKNAKK